MTEDERALGSADHEPAPARRRIPHERADNDQLKSSGAVRGAAMRNTQKSPMIIDYSFRFWFCLFRFES